MAEVNLWVPDSFAQEQVQKQEYGVPAGTDVTPDKNVPAPRGLMTPGPPSRDWGGLTGQMRTLSSPRVKREELIGLWRQHNWVRSGIKRIALVCIAEGWEIVEAPDELEEGEEADPDAKAFLQRFFDPEIDVDIVNIRQWELPLMKMWLTFVHLKLFGECSWELVKDGFANVVDFAPLYGRVIPNVDRRGNFLKPEQAYLQVMGATKTPFAQDEVLRFAMLDIDGRFGVSDLEAIELAASTDIWAQIWNRNSFLNNRLPAAVYRFAVGAKNEDMKEFSDYLDARAAGAQHANKAPVVRGVDDITVLGTAFAKDAEFLRGRKFNRDEIFANLGVSAGTMGMVEDVNRANLEGLISILYHMEAKPLQEPVAGVINAWRKWKLGIRGWRFRFKSPDFTDEAADAETAERRIRSGTRSPNEERARDGLPPYPGGDMFVMPSNVLAVGKPAEEDRLSEEQEEEVEMVAPSEVATDEQIAGELRRWRKVAVKLMRQGRPQREFETVVIPEGVRRIVHMAALATEDEEGLQKLFDQVIEVYSPRKERGGLPDWAEGRLDERERELAQLATETAERSARQLVGTGDLE